MPSPPFLLPAAPLCEANPKASGHVHALHFPLPPGSSARFKVRVGGGVRLIDFRVCRIADLGIDDACM